MPTKEQVLNQMELDLKTVKALEARGTNLEIVHAVEHHFVSARDQTLKELLRIGDMLGFDPSSIEQNLHADKKAYYFADLISDQYVDVAMLARESILMTALAEAFGCEYDGWGTQIKK